MKPIKTSIANVLGYMRLQAIQNKSIRFDKRLKKGLTKIYLN